MANERSEPGNPSSQSGDICAGLAVLATVQPSNGTSTNRVAHSHLVASLDQLLNLRQQLLKLGRWPPAVGPWQRSRL